MGIFGRNIERTYGVRAALELVQRPSGRAPVSIVSPWSPPDFATEWAVDDALAGILDRPNPTLTREAALRIPAIKRAHGIICAQLAGIPFYEMDDAQRVADQPEWLTNSASGVAPYHRMFGAASDWFFEGWACFGFTDDMTDCLHIPFGMWTLDDDGYVLINGTAADLVPLRYQATMVAVPLGYGENGILHDARDTIDQAQKIDAAYQARLDNPIPLTVLSIRDDLYAGYTPVERAKIRDEWNEGRRKNSTALKPASMTVDLPGATVGSDLYETGRNAVRLDLANHTGLPASILEGVRQGGSGGGTEMRYQGVGNGGERSDLWEFGPARRMLLAFEARMSLDDIVPSGHSIRGDLTNMNATPTPNTTPTSED